MKQILPIVLLSLGIFQACRSTSSLSLNMEEIIDCYVDDGHIVDYLKLSRLNLALAETGQLADKAFHYTQAGSNGILVPWGLSVESGEILSDIYWSMGHIAYAQRMAMEANVLDEREYNPRMMLRSIETNLVYGAYEIADKYISILEGDVHYCETARRYRMFLHDDKAVETDPVLGLKRKCIPAKDFISLVWGVDEDLKDIIRVNPAHHNSIEYLGIIYLLDCEMDSFKAMLDEFYGTPALPELPASFAEAACMLSEINQNYWKEVGVSQKTYNRYREFKKRLGTGLSMDKYNDTFWYYIMRVNSQ